MARIVGVDSLFSKSNSPIQSVIVKTTDISTFKEALKKPISIPSVIFRTDRATQPTHYRQLITAIVRHNTLPKCTPVQNLMISVDTLSYLRGHEPELDPMLENLKGLQCPITHFKLQIFYVKDYPEVFNKVVSILQSGTNFNEFHISNKPPFSDPIPLDGIKQFCEYFVENKDRLISLAMDRIVFSPDAAQCVIQLLRQYSSFTKVELELTSLHSDAYNVYDILAQSNIEDITVMWHESPLNPVHLEGIVRLLQNSKKLTALTLAVKEEELLTGGYLQRGLIATKTLQKFEVELDFTMIDFGTLFSAIEQNKSIVKYTVYHLDAKDVKKLAAIEQRNRRIQNARVHTMVTLLYNMARHHHDNNDTSSLSLSVTSSAWYHLPRDVWTIIVSFITFPGVTSLDFGKVARSIFNDQSIRRVI